MIELLTDRLLSQDAIEWAGLLTGLGYIILAIYERPVCWWFGIISSACLAWKGFFDYRLIADGILQLFYIGIGIVGLWRWYAGASGGRPAPVKTHPWQVHALALAVCALLSIPVSWLLIRYAGARYGYPDTLLTMLSIWATWLLTRKDLHQWLYWIAIDFVFVWLYWVSGGYLFSALFLIYGVLAIWGWRQWQRTWRARQVAGGNS